MTFVQLGHLLCVSSRKISRYFEGEFLFITLCSVGNWKENVACRFTGFVENLILIDVFT